ncbi:precorrin-4 C(11)-methyltransferase [Nocardioides sp. R-C-SC26]|uniref:precorrin-4 C(11)-methyltransferase n=1 Tax=Nocardioides sp. R-C-SC26 TaxID=2870414 RepID=UPI001E4DC5BF|nr:precorrin-4 C(11)-methyltransferase [Nocardioides sp. R-C-SC26]
MTVHFVGAGPGAADLITVRAMTLLGQADVVLYPGTYIDQAVLAHCDGARVVDTQDLDLEQMVQIMVEAHAADLDVVRLTSGDPSVYSALAEQTRRLDEAGVPWDVTPGVAAYAAAAAVVGRELTVPLVAQSVVITRAQARSTQMPAGESLAAFAATRATLAVHLAITRVRDVMDEVVEHYGPACPVVVVYRASQPEQIVLRGTVADIADRVETAGLRQAAVILVGEALRRDDVGTPGFSGGESYLYSSTRDRSTKR